MATATKVYLGDSVYADFDGYYVWLTTENGLPLDPSNRIAIEPQVMHALMDFVTELKNSDVCNLTPQS